MKLLSTLSCFVEDKYRQENRWAPSAWRWTCLLHWSLSHGLKRGVCFSYLSWERPLYILCLSLLHGMSPLRKKNHEFHTEHFTNTSSWRANLCHWFFWPSPISVLSLTNQIQLKFLTASFFSNLKPLRSMLLHFLFYFWHHLRYKHQSSQLCARILIALWLESSLTRIWSFHKALLMEILNNMSDGAGFRLLRDTGVM